VAGPHDGGRRDGPPAADRPRLALADLRDAPWALPPPGTAPHDAILRIFHDAGWTRPDRRHDPVGPRAQALVAQAGYLSYLRAP